MCTFVRLYAVTEVCPCRSRSFSHWCSHWTEWELYLLAASLVLIQDGEKKDWTCYWDCVVVDAIKPLFFAEGTILRKVDKVRRTCLPFPPSLSVWCHLHSSKAGPCQLILLGKKYSPVRWLPLTFGKLLVWWKNCWIQVVLGPVGISHLTTFTALVKSGKS